MIQAVQEHYAAQHPKVGAANRISREFEGWLMNNRASNMEQLLRFSIDTRSDHPALVVEQLSAIGRLISANIVWI